MTLSTLARRALTIAAPAALACSLALPTQAHAQYNQQGGFYNGVNQGGRGGNYDRDHRYDDRDHYRNDHYNDYRNGDYRNGNYHQGGIGPGKGALIGAGGGALLGAVFGGGLKGTLIGGAAGAGIGAVVGKDHQDNVRRNDGYYPR